MPRILFADDQHETYPTTPGLADWVAITRGDSFSAFVRGAAISSSKCNAGSDDGAN